MNNKIESFVARVFVFVLLQVVAKYKRNFCTLYRINWIMSGTVDDKGDAPLAVRSVADDDGIELLVPSSDDDSMEVSAVKDSDLPLHFRVAGSEIDQIGRASCRERV